MAGRGRKPSSTSQKKEEVKEIKEESKEQELKATEKKEVPKPVEEKPNRLPDVAYIKSDHLNGVVIGQQICRFKAGDEIKDKHLMWKLKNLNIEIVESLAECDIEFISRK